MNAPYLHNLASLRLALEAQHILADSAEIPVVTIRRDPLERAWVYDDASGCKVVTPFADSADAPRVASWLKTQAFGRLKVKIDLTQ